MAPELPETPAPDPAPAPPALSHAETVLTREHASTDERYLAFKQARHDERAGTAPAPETPEPKKEPVVVPPVAAKQEETERQTSKRQQQINDYERRIAELEAKLATPPPTREPAPARATTDPEPDPTKTETYPDGQFDRQYLKDIAAWQTRQTLREHDASRQADSVRQRDVETFQARASKTKETFQAALTADPTLADSIDPQLFRLEPTLNLKPGETPTFGHAVADWIAQSDHPVELLKHLSNKAEVARLANLSPRDFLRETGRIEATFTAPATAPATPTIVAKTVTDSPDPPHTLGKRPQEAIEPTRAAVANGDFAAYQRAKRASGVLHYGG